MNNITETTFLSTLLSKKVKLNQLTLTLQKYERWPNCFSDYKEQDWFYALQNSTVSIFIIIIIIIISFITVFAGVLFVYQPGANHAPRASVT